jgi:hypothetical protein
MDLVDLFPVYPFDDETLSSQILLAKKKEFIDLMASSDEQPPERGDLYKPQKLILRALEFKDKILLNWGPGTGKSCAMIAPAESYKNASNPHEQETRITILADVIQDILSSNRFPIERVIVLVKGDTLAGEFRRQIICRCNSSVKYEDRIDMSKDTPAIEAEITRMLKTWYQISTYRTFASEIAKIVSPGGYQRDPEVVRKDLQRLYSGTLFIVDEAHNLRSGGKKGREALPEGEEVSGGEKTDKITYNMLHLLFHSVYRSKFLIATATPMINEPDEISTLMNLLLPLENQMPSRSREEYSRLRLDDVTRYFRNYISYVRELETGATPVFMGQTIQGESWIDEDGYEHEAEGEYFTKIYPTAMGEFQANVYKQIEKEARGGVFYNERQAALFVFPDGSIGGSFPSHGSRKEGMGKYIITNGDDEDDFSGTPELMQALAPPLEGNETDNLYRYSAKFATILDIELEASRNEKGKAFIYSEYVVGGGTTILAIAFEAMGFERFRSKDWPFEKVEGRKQTYCGSDEGRRLKPSLRKGVPRFAVITSKTPTAYERNILNVFNSPENWDGSIIQVVIGSQGTRDGINFMEIVREHFTGSSWTKSAEKQAMFRGIRAGSHSITRQKRREQAIREGKDPDTVTVPVSIYLHAAILEDTQTSIDVSMYIGSENKDRAIKHVERLMKICAIDCPLNKQANTRPYDVTGTPACDYQSCNYRCSDIDRISKNPDRTTFDFLYSRDLLDALIRKFNDEVGRGKTLFTFGELYQLSEKPKYVDLVISMMIAKRTPLRDSFGLTCYLASEGDRVFLVRDYPNTTPRLLDNLYVSETTLLEREPFAVLALEAKALTAAVREEEIITLEPESEEFKEAISTLDELGKSKLLEEAVIAKETGQETSFTKSVLRHFAPHLFVLEEPTKYITFAREWHEMTHRGRKPGEGQVREIVWKNTPVGIPELESPLRNKVYVHRMKEFVKLRAAHAEASRLLTVDRENLRILKPSRGLIWKDVTDLGEQIVYKELLEQELYKRRVAFAAAGVYGSVGTSDNVFRMIDPRTEKILSREDLNKRNVKRGRECKTWNKNNLIEIAAELRIPNEIPPLSVEDSKRYLQGFPLYNSEDSDDKIISMAQWANLAAQPGQNKEKICSRIRVYLEKKGRIYEEA